MNTWDCHAHVIGDPDRYRLWDGRGYEPPLASLEDYLAVLDRHEFTHGVLVQPSVYRFDNRCMLDALDRAEGRLVGVAVPAPESTARDLEKLHERGVRGVRCNTVNPGGLDVAVALGWQQVMKSLGWHVELQIELDSGPDVRSLIDTFDVPVAIDHMGRPANPAPFARLVEAVRNGKCFVKLSAPYRFPRRSPSGQSDPGATDGPDRDSHRGPPASTPASHWSLADPFARALIAASPAACLWASDWPHVDHEPPVDTENVFATVSHWCPDPEVRRTILSEAPATLFGRA